MTAMWFDECHGFAQVHLAWIFGIAQCEERECIRFSDGVNAVELCFSQDMFWLHGDECAREVFDDIRRIGLWLGHTIRVVKAKRLDARIGRCRRTVAVSS